MIVRSSNAVSFLVEFPSGFPDGNVTWTLSGADGQPMASGSVTPDAGAVSINIKVSGDLNVVPTGTYTSFRDLDWTYETKGSVVNGEARYILEARLPFGVSAAGVRTKLGIDDASDLPDSEISLVKAYDNFKADVGADVLAAADPTSVFVRDALEAAAALQLLPTLSIRLAQKEDSGTSSYQRGTADYQTLTASLTNMVTSAKLSLNPLYDDTVGYSSIFILATPATDPFTGSAYS